MGKSGGFHAGFGHEGGPVRIVFPGEDIRNLRVSLPVCMAAYAFGRFFRLDNMLPVKSEVRPVFFAPAGYGRHDFHDPVTSPIPRARVMLRIPCPPSISSAGRMACATETLHVEKCGILWKCVERAVWKTSGCSACFYGLRVSRTPELAARVRLARKQKGGSRRGCLLLRDLHP